jgi:FixJ family two-component response regulator
VAKGRKVIAIIDNDVSMREGLGLLLTSLGYLIEVYSSGEEFIDAAMKSEAGCLLIDIQLGDVTGVELGRHLLTLGLTFPIIFMTASQDPIFRKQAAEFGCIAYLQKPFPPNQFVKAITEAIGQN